jgi:hypothetical protein
VDSPSEDYAARKRDRQTRAEALERRHIRLGNAKVSLFIAAIVYGLWALDGDPSAGAFGVGAAVFVALSVWHENVMRALSKARTAVAYYEQGAARIEDRWMREEPSGERFRDRDHPYADDLDLFGPRSLFQLVSGCRTPMGEERLALWLLRVSPIAEVRDRQLRVAALRPHVDLRERIAVVNAGRRQAIDARRLIEWSEQPGLLPPIRILVVLLAVAFLVALFVYMNGGPGIFLAMVPAANLVMVIWLGRRANAVVEGLASATQSSALDLMADVIAEIEREPFADGALSGLAMRFTGGDTVPAASQGLARLARISDWVDSRHNVFVRLAEIPILFTLQLAFAAERWRLTHGRRLRDWVDAIGEIEALLSLAGYAYEHPRDPFAEIVDTDSPFLVASEAAHPLIPAAAVVRNSLSLSGPGPRILIVSGSNMSGKSTLLRTVGTNVLLALAGAPVRADALRLSPLAIGTCLRHTDSLQERRSGFYTEALRVRLIADLLDGPLPVLFLFDELLSGTNSKDRRIAAEGVIRTMLARGAVGLVTTHDLALTEIAAICPAEMRNVHLQDTVSNGVMAFDYKLRDGVITHSNALELMRIIGLDV